MCRGAAAGVKDTGGLGARRQGGQRVGRQKPQDARAESIDMGQKGEWRLPPGFGGKAERPFTPRGHREEWVWGKERS